MKCEQCGTELPEGWTSCPVCGATQMPHPLHLQAEPTRPSVAPPHESLWGWVAGAAILTCCLSLLTVAVLKSGLLEDVGMETIVEQLFVDLCEENGIPMDEYVISELELEKVRDDEYEAHFTIETEWGEIEKGTFKVHDRLDGTEVTLMPHRLPPSMQRDLFSSR